MDFVNAIELGILENIRLFPKSDLHNHFVLGGNREYIKSRTGINIVPITNPLKNMDEMHQWNRMNIGNYFDSKEGRRVLIDATFTQAKIDGVTVLEIGEDVWGLAEFFNNDIYELIDAFESAKDRIAPDIELRLQIGLSRHCEVSYLIDCLRHFWGHKEFYSIDLYGDELAQPIENFIPIYDKAKENGLALKAHVGEWGSAHDVKKACEVLGLNEVQHGISAADDEEVISFLRERKIRLNITPSSNVLLGRVNTFSEHPVSKLFRAGIDVTLNSDDVLIFDSDVSKEYLRLYQSGCLTAQELDMIRINGLMDRKIL